MLNPEKWLEKYGDYLYSLAMLKTGKKEVSEDLVQDTFVSAFGAIDSFRGGSAEKTWLVSILQNKITDYYRKKDVLKDSDDYLQQTDTTFYSNFFDTESGHWNTGYASNEWLVTDNPSEQKEFYTVLHKCIEKMPAKLSGVFLSKFMDENTSENICKEMNLSPSNYWVIIHRAKLLMKNCLELNWFIK
ncbi:MAG TPA: sigma-70 family RNA polymerase sigma factor [Bacteroidia bacterium]|nr:sigma-70 family RNA polymerase sigma factor [Bacteroidia bacterium]